MVFAMPATAFAYNTYVGLKIESVNHPTASVPTEWCLPSASTTMTIKDGDTTLDTVTTISETCPGGTIWSGLVELTSQTSYTVLLSTSLAGYYKNGYFWFGYGPAGDSCNTYCSSLGFYCVDPGSHDGDLTFADMRIMTGLSGYGEWTYAYNSTPMFDGTQFTMNTGAGQYTCSATYTGWHRFCTCGGSAMGNYSFTFTAPAE